MRRPALICLLFLIALPSACRKNAQRPEGPRPSDRVIERTLDFYYESEDLLLHAERRGLRVPENEAAALGPVLREFLKGPRNPAQARPFPPDVVLRGVYLLPDGNAIVDLGGATLTAGWNTGTHSEILAVYSLVQTLAANFSNVRQVRILVNGQAAETLAGHIRLDRPLRPAPDLLAKR